MREAHELSLDARAAYVQLAIADHAKQVREAPETCSPDEVDGMLEAYAAARTLCHEVARGERAPVSIPDLGHIAENKQYSLGELRAILTGIEIKCFKGVGALVRIIALIPNEEAHHE